jgi:flagellar biosynthetic protein FliR
MGNTAAILSEEAVALLLLFGRTGAFLGMSPVLRRLPVPRLPATALVLFVALLLKSAGLGPEAARGLDAEPLRPGWHLVEMMVVEVAIGFLLGLASLLVFEGMRLGGAFLGISMGMAGVNLLDPTDQSQQSATGMLYGLAAGLVFFLLDGHHAVLRVLALSYTALPVGAQAFPAGAGGAMVAMVGNMFVFAMRVAAPVLAALIITDVATAILGRAVPRMPIFFLTLPFKIGLGLVIMALTFAAATGLFADHLGRLEHDLLELLIAR